MKKLRTLISALIIIGLSIGIARVLEAGALKLPIKQYFPTNHTIAVWDWTNPINRTAASLKSLNDFYYLHQINTVYLDISAYADIYQHSNKDNKLKLENALASYINAVKARRVQVYAAAGNTDWSKPNERYIPLAIQNFVFDYNSSHKNAMLSGIEFDIEAYNQAGFPQASSTEKSIVLSEYLNTVQQLTANQLKSISHFHDKIALGFAIPYWFDNENGNIPQITWNGKTGPTLYHLIDNLNQLPVANIDVMSYRNAATGNDGSIFHARTEVEYAGAKAPHVKVLIGQEINDVQPSKITFYGMGWSALSAEVGLINDAFRNNSSYTGIAIDDLQGLQKMNNSSSTTGSIY